jgi:hypothetical protein
MRTVTTTQGSFVVYETTNELDRVGRQYGLTFHACSTTFANSGWTRQVTTSTERISQWTATCGEKTSDGAPVWRKFGLDLAGALAYATGTCPCGKPGRLVPDPYAKEMFDEDVLAVLCDGCEQDRRYDA